MPLMIHVASGSWRCPVPLTLVIVLGALVYARGWLRLRSTSPSVIPPWRAGGLLLGLFLIWVAVASPIARCDQGSLTVHMAQHLLLQTVAPPLILLGAPLISLWHGLPRRFLQAVITPLFRWPPAQCLGRALGDPALCWLAATVTLVGWHIPAAFMLGLRSDAWHGVEHASFLVTGILFWWPVVQPWPSVPRWPSWSVVLYLFLATLPCDILSGFLVFSDRVAYSAYLLAPGASSASVLADQQCAGALMWTCVTCVYLAAGAFLSTRLLSARSHGGDGLVRSEAPGGAVPRADLRRAEVG